MELKKIDILSLSKYFAIFGLIIGLILGILIGVYTNSAIKSLQNPEIATAITQQYGADGVTLMTENLRSLGKTALYALPLMFLVASFIIGLLTAIIYNLLAKYTGGIRFELTEKKK